MPTAIPRLEKQGMLSRALSLATVTLLIGCLTAGVAAAENLDAGKSPSQIFSSTCNACHKSPRGLLKSVSASSLPGFLRQHYTTGTDMASVLSSYLISNGAADPRYQGKDAKQKDAKQDGKPDQPDRLGRRQPPAAPAQEAARPDAEGTPQGEGGRRGRDAKRFARPHAVPDAAKPDGQAPAQAATDSKSGVRQKQGRRGKPPAAEEPPKAEQASPGDAANDASRDAAKAETAAPDPAKTDVIKTDGVKDEGDKPAGDAAKPAGETEKPGREDRSEAAKVDAAKDNAGSEPNPLRPDPVPPVTPAPPASATTAPEPGSSAASPPPATATAPASPAGPPVPPISR
jgi:hypothetical protein